MALKKKRVFKNGTSAEYHNVAAIELIPFSRQELKNPPTEEEKKRSKAYYDLATNPEMITKTGYRMTVTVRSFASRKVRDADPSLYLESFKRSKEYSREEFDSKNIFTQAYDLIKQTEEFANSEDV